MHHRCRRPHPGKQNPQTRPLIPYSYLNVPIRLGVPQAGVPQHMLGIPASAHCPRISSAFAKALRPRNGSLSVFDLRIILKQSVLTQPDFGNVL